MFDAIHLPLSRKWGDPVTLRLLVTIRDVSAALHLVQVVRALKGDARFETRILAQQPASRILRSMEIEHVEINAPAATTDDSPEALHLLAIARSELSAYRPDAVLAGLSTPFDGGIDEAVLAEANVPSYLLQDFWGEQNKFFGKGAGLFFALDATAAEMNRRRFGVESVIVGSARHAAYAEYNFQDLRNVSRRDLGISGKTPVIGFFGQALNRLPGYRRTLITFIRAVESLGSDIQILVRMHPRETEKDVVDTLAAFASSSLKPVIANHGSVDECLAACDVVCSLFSNCTYDASYQNYYSTVPISVPVSLLFDVEIAEYYRERVSFEELPLHRHRLVLPVYRQDLVAATLATALTEREKSQISIRAKTHLSDPSDACRLILETILACTQGGKSMAVDLGRS